jgi:Cd2+/Zn2+-exporting ATPase
LRLPVAEIILGDTTLSNGRADCHGRHREERRVGCQPGRHHRRIRAGGKDRRDSIYAGTVNEHGVLEIAVTKVAADSTLAKIMHLVEEAQARKAPSQQFVDVFAKYYTPAVLFTAAAVMAVPWLVFGQPFAPWFYKGLVLLVISCPCALVYRHPSPSSPPSATSRGAACSSKAAPTSNRWAAKGDRLRQNRHTHRRSAGRHRCPAAVGRSENDLLAIAAAIEKWSEHPLAQAVVARAAGAEPRQAANFKALVGLGAQADLDGRTLYVGSLRLFEELGHDLAPYEPVLAGLERQGRTVMLVGAQDEITA